MPPLISVVIPSYNRRELLRRCLDSLAGQDLAPDLFEVVVVIDGSHDGSAEMAKALSVPFVLRVIEQANVGIAGALNTGAAAAEAPYLLFFGDDMFLAPATVRSHLEAQQAASGVVAIGPIATTATHHGYPQFAIQFWKTIERNRGRRPLRFSDMFGGNLSVPTAAWLETGGFDTSLIYSEDLEFAYRLGRAGLAFAFVPAGATHQLYVKTTRQALQGSIANGAACVVLVRRYPGMLEDLRLAWLGRMPTVRQRLLRAAVAVPLPMAPFVWFGALPNVPPVRRLYKSMENYWYMRGARAEAQKDQSWAALTARRNRRRR